MRATSFFILTFFLLACQETHKEATKEQQIPKDTLTNKVVRKKVTFEDIKGRFLHKDLRVVSSVGQNFYEIVSFPKDTCKNLISKEDLEDIGLNQKTYQHKRNKYFAYSLHQTDIDNWIGLAGGGEYMTFIDYFRLDKRGQNPEFVFSLKSEADGGRGRKDFAIFHKDYVDIHLLSIYVDTLTHKNYRLTWKQPFTFKTDTLINIKQKDKRWDIFIETLKKYGLTL
jgi:hypothetical protein